MTSTLRPLFHDFDGRTVVIVGGGPVGLRKARTYADAADVRVYAPEFVDGFADLACTTVRRRLETEDVRDVVEEAFLVVPATDDRAFNDAVAEIATDVGCLVNRVDERGTTVAPSRAESERITVAISTEGASPAVSKYLREQIEPLLERADPMVALQAALRAELQADDERSAASRRDALWDVLEDERVWEFLAEGREAAARSRARALANGDE